ncbi:hypothetical protein [Natroniella sp. ANB-PHB2]|uniref:hypothetical protein n=1 Tax=Natroniella sp. ANB-PHB2 TaxID=3384444 RepID=UPI0038D4153E
MVKKEKTIEIDRIYHSKDVDRAEVIYQLSNGVKVINRSKEIIKKLNVDKWEEVSFVPEGFEEVSRNITSQEERELKKFLDQFQTNKQSEQDKWLKNIWQKIINLFKR